MKIRHYEVIDGLGCYVICWQEGDWKESKIVALTNGRSKADRRAALLLVEQANHAAELLDALKIAQAHSPCNLYVEVIAKAEGRS